MKITKEQLKQIIKEELENVLESQSNIFGRYGLDDWGDWGAKDGPRMTPKKKKTKTDPSTGEKKKVKEMIDPGTGESTDGSGRMIAEIDEIIERNLREGSVERAVWELEHYTPDQIAEYAGSLTSMDRLKAQYIQAIEDTMRY